MAERPVGVRAVFLAVVFQVWSPLAALMRDVVTRCISAMSPAHLVFPKKVERTVVNCVGSWPFSATPWSVGRVIEVKDTPRACQVA